MAPPFIGRLLGGLLLIGHTLAYGHQHFNPFGQSPPQSSDYQSSAARGHTTYFHLQSSQSGHQHQHQPQSPAAPSHASRYSTPAEVTVYPRGFVMRIPAGEANADVNGMRFQGRCMQRPPGGSGHAQRTEFSQIVRQPVNGYWTYVNPYARLQLGDMINYRVMANSRRRGAYVCDQQSFAVNEIQNEPLPYADHSAANPADSPPEPPQPINRMYVPPAASAPNDPVILNPLKPMIDLKNQVKHILIGGLLPQPRQPAPVNENQPDCGGPNASCQPPPLCGGGDGGACGRPNPMPPRSPYLPRPHEFPEPESESVPQPQPPQNGPMQSRTPYLPPPLPSPMVPYNPDAEMIPQATTPRTEDAALAATSPSSSIKPTYMPPPPPPELPPPPNAPQPPAAQPTDNNPPPPTCDQAPSDPQCTGDLTNSTPPGPQAANQQPACNAPAPKSAPPTCSCPAPPPPTNNPTVPPAECAAISAQLADILRHIQFIEQRSAQLLSKVDTLEEVQVGILTEQAVAANRSRQLLMTAPQVDERNALRDVRRIVDERLELPALRDRVVSATATPEGVVIKLRTVGDKLRVLFRAKKRAEVAHVVMIDFDDGAPDAPDAPEEESGYDGTDAGADPDITLEKAFSVFDDLDGDSDVGKNSSEWSSVSIDVRMDDSTVPAEPAPTAASTPTTQSTTKPTTKPTKVPASKPPTAKPPPPDDTVGKMKKKGSMEKFD